jgi:hypothetical protein
LPSVTVTGFTIQAYESEPSQPMAVVTFTFALAAEPNVDQTLT